MTSGRKHNDSPAPYEKHAELFTKFHGAPEWANSRLENTDSLPAKDVYDSFTYEEKMSLVAAHQEGRKELHKDLKAIVNKAMCGQKGGDYLLLLKSGKKIDCFAGFPFIVKALEEWFMDAMAAEYICNLHAKPEEAAQKLHALVDNAILRITSGKKA